MCPFTLGRARAVPGLVSPGGRMGRAGTFGRRCLFGGRSGCGAPGSAAVRVPRGGRAAGCPGLAAPARAWGAADAAAVLGRGRLGGAAWGAPARMGALSPGAGRLGGGCGFGTGGWRRTTGGLGTLGRPGSRLILGRATCFPSATAGGASGLSPPSAIRSEARVASIGLGFDDGLDFAGRGGATLDLSGGVSAGGRGGAAWRAGGVRGRTGGRNGPMGG